MVRYSELCTMNSIPYSIFHIPSRRGFTIIETLVAVAVLLLSIITPLTIAEKGLASAEAARTEITAFYLGQEAVEYVRSVRDSNAIGGKGGQSNWLQGLSQCATSSGCGIDSTASGSGQIITCNPGNDNCTLYTYTGLVTELRGLFGHRTSTGWTRTDYTRVVHLQDVLSDVETEVKVTVTWPTRFGTRSIDVVEHIFNWYNSDASKGNNGNGNGKH